MQTNDESTRMESVSLSQKFAEIDGRRPRVFIPELEDNGCHKERKMAAALLADAGWDVDVGAPQSAEESAQTASDNDVHFIYYLSRSNGKTALLVKMMQALTVMGRDDILTAVHDCSDSEKNHLIRYGVTAAFPETYPLGNASITMLHLLLAREEDEDAEI